MSLSKTPYSPLSTGSTQESSQNDQKIVDWLVKHQHKQTFDQGVENGLQCPSIIVNYSYNAN